MLKNKYDHTLCQSHLHTASETSVRHIKEKSDRVLFSVRDDDEYETMQKCWTQTFKGAKGTKTLKVQSHLAKLEPRDADFANFYWLWKWLLCELCFMRRYTINKIPFLPNLADISLMWPHLNIHCLFLGTTASEPRRIPILTVQFNLILKCHNWFRTSIWKHQGSPASDRNCLQDTLIEVKVFSRISKRQMFRGNMRSVYIIP